MTTGALEQYKRVEVAAWLAVARSTCRGDCRRCFGWKAEQAFELLNSSRQESGKTFLFASVVRQSAAEFTFRVEPVFKGMSNCEVEGMVGSGSWTNSGPTTTVKCQFQTSSVEAVQMRVAGAGAACWVVAMTPSFKLES